MTDHTQTVREIYAAFKEGRVSDILAVLTDDVTFIQPGGSDIPWARTWLGRNQVGAFFATLNDAVAVATFEPREYVAQGETVIAMGAWSGMARSTGKPFACAWSMTWKFKGGKVWFYEAYEDTDALAAAFR